MIQSLHKTSVLSMLLLARPSLSGAVYDFTRTIPCTMTSIACLGKAHSNQVRVSTLDSLPHFPVNPRPFASFVLCHRIIASNLDILANSPVSNARAQNLRSMQKEGIMISIEQCLLEPRRIVF
ncbi:hypothetical protein EV424DRAFT_255305 [Suillus variegatus]|nr:hypothetical protein EV424DRAFT_255305 [Suillus variegatus]